MRTRTRSDRGQAYALEGLIAALIVVGSVLVGLQAVDTTPWVTNGDDVASAGQQVEAHDILSIAADDGSLSRAIRCVKSDGSGEPHPNVGEPPSISPTILGKTIGDSLIERNFKYRLSVSYWDPSSGAPARTWLHGESLDPKSSATTATKTVVLTDSMTVYKNVLGDCRKPGKTLDGSSSYYIPDTSPRTDVYNVVEVRLETWPEGSA